MTASVAGHDIDNEDLLEADLLGYMAATKAYYIGKDKPDHVIQLDRDAGTCFYEAFADFYGVRTIDIYKIESNDNTVLFRDVMNLVINGRKQEKEHLTRVAKRCLKISHSPTGLMHLVNQYNENRGERVKLKLTPDSSNLLNNNE